MNSNKYKHITKCDNIECVNRMLCIRFNHADGARIKFKDICNEKNKYPWLWKEEEKEKEKEKKQKKKNKK